MTTKTCEKRVCVKQPRNKRIAFVAIASVAFCAGTAYALDDIIVPALDGVGDVIALTNAITKAKAGEYRNVLLTEGVYDLKDIEMTSGTHLDCTSFSGHMLVGMGSQRGDTILKGGGVSSGCRVVNLQGNNWNYATLSNLTVTGGYAPSGNGGGISGHASARIIDCIVSNNFAYGSKNFGGGGMFKGTAIRCLFVDNGCGRDNTVAIHGGGMWCNGDTTPGGLYQHVVDCVFSNNWCRDNGGGFYGPCDVSGCTFVGNAADASGGALYLTGGGCASNCYFRLNSAKEGCAVMGLSAANMVFASEFLQNTNGSASAINSVTCYDSIVTNHYGTRTVLKNCNLNGCRVADNKVEDSPNATYIVDAVDSGVACTNANCIFEGNVSSGTAGSGTMRISGAKTILNCTYATNRVNSSNYGYIIDSGAIVYNTVYLENRVGSYDNFNKNSGCPTLINCVYSGAPSAIEDSEKCTGVFKATRAELKFSAGDAARPYVPSIRSPLRDAAFTSDWILQAVGDKDVYGRVRVFGDGLDIGASECVEKKIPGFILSVH